jgi:hypothetical protein
MQRESQSGATRQMRKIVTNLKMLASDILV